MKDDLLFQGIHNGYKALTGFLRKDMNGDMSGLPLTTVEHDNSQLMWNRHSLKFKDKKVPLCIQGCRCAGSRLQGSPGPLHVYLSKIEQELFDNQGICKEEGPCLLCIRLTLTELFLLNGNVQNNFSANVVLPPFNILVDQPGGYAKQYCLTPDVSPLIGAPFPKSTGTLTVCTDELNTKWYIDQGPMVYNAPENPLN